MPALELARHQFIRLTASGGISRETGCPLEALIDLDEPDLSTAVTDSFDVLV
ncbi:MAG: hypothetical protein QNJ16_20205 [Rhodobacter sp.]|nr:hypothetical protein [Rhodobacter sp.]